ncbi:MAG: YqgE/AlgH family protein [Pseudomonadota bacterium]
MSKFDKNTIKQVNEYISFAPGILISSPELKDPNFYQTVVLLVEHNSSGSFGLVVNRPLETTVAEILSSLDIPYLGPTDRPLFLGGPVGLDRVCFIHSSKFRWKDTLRLTDSISLSFSTEGLKELAQLRNERYYVFVGSSGWGALQLENEITSNAWLTYHIVEKLLFDTHHEKMWGEAFRIMGIDPLMLSASTTTTIQ